MPGPGGGGRGGGFGGGHRGGGYYHRRYYSPFGFFGFGGGILGIFFMPFLLMLFAGIILFTVVFGAFGSVAQGGVTEYQEKEFQDYADAEYRKAFGQSTAYEDNILLVFLTNEEADGYYCIAWVGKHIENDINYLFGGAGSALGAAMDRSINTAGYWYSLDSGLAMAVDTMADFVVEEGLSSSFSCEEEHVQVDSKLINYGEYQISEEIVNAALTDFTDRTGISMSIVVNDVGEVFSTNYSQMIGGIIMILIFVGLAVFFIVKGVRNRRAGGRGNGDYNPFD